MEIATFNMLEKTRASGILTNCCSATRWVMQVLEGRPYRSLPDLQQRAERIWSEMTESDWLEAFEGHPRIGDPDSLKKKYRETLELADSEQSSVRHADEKTLQGLARGNQTYLDRFGFIFIIYATGKSASQMFEHLQNRLGNCRETELKTAAGEQWKITRRRLSDLFPAEQGQEA